VAYKVYQENIFNRIGSRLRGAAGKVYAKLRNANVQDAESFYKFVGIFKSFKNKYEDFKKDAVKLGIANYPIVSDFISEIGVIIKNYDGIAQSYQSYRTGFTPYHVSTDTFVRHVRRLDADFRRGIKDLVGFFQDAFPVLFPDQENVQFRSFLKKQNIKAITDTNKLIHLTKALVSRVKWLLLDTTKNFYNILNRHLPSALWVVKNVDIKHKHLVIFFNEFERLEGIFNDSPGLAEILNANPKTDKEIIEFFYYYGKKPTRKLLGQASRFIGRTYRLASRQLSSLMKKGDNEQESEVQNEQENVFTEEQLNVARKNYLKALTMFHDYIVIAYRLLSTINSFNPAQEKA